MSLSTHDTTKVPLIQIKNINKHFYVGEQDLHVLKDVEMRIDEGDFVSVMGPSGSGKSTLINVVGFLDNDFTGDYFFEGERIQQRTDRQISHLRNEKVGFVFQSFNLIDSMNVRDNVKLPLLYAGYSSRQTAERVDEILASVGLADKKLNFPHELSGGQRQRVAIARALVNNPDFLIADEPTGALDTRTANAIMEIFAKLHREGTTIILVTHDPTLQRFANKHIVIIDGMVQEVEADEAVELIQRYQLQREDVPDED